MKIFLLLFSISILLYGCSTQFSDILNSDTLFSAEPTFIEDFNDSSVNESIWQIATWSEHGGQTSKARCFVKNGYLNLVFVNDSTLGYLSSAIQSRDTYSYGRWEVRLKPSTVSGVLNSFYTIDWGDGSGSKEEIDIEFLTKSFRNNYGEVHFAVHEEGYTSFQTNPDPFIDFNPSLEFHIWAMEITPEYIKWFVDNEELKSYYYNTGDIAINYPYQLKMNTWTKEHWIDGPPEEDLECIYLVDWIRFYPYITQ